MLGTLAENHAAADRYKESGSTPELVLFHFATLPPSMIRPSDEQLDTVVLISFSEVSTWYLTLERMPGVVA